jgi:DNA-binding beta-propeller fold protein YncE
MSSDSAELFVAGPEDYSLWGQSPDGMWFIVTANRKIPGKWRLLRVPVAGGTPEVILTPTGVAEVHCANAASRICVLAEDLGKQMTFSIVDPVRGRLEELAKLDTPEFTRWSLSPDGSKIALMNDDSDNVRVFDLHSKQVQVIHPTPPQKLLQKLAWSADGKRIFLSGIAENGNGRLLEMDLSGNTHLLLKNPMGWIAEPVPSPDGKRLAYIYLVVESNITLLEHF